MKVTPHQLLKHVVFALERKMLWCVVAANPQDIVRRNVRRAIYPIMLHTVRTSLHWQIL